MKYLNHAVGLLHSGDVEVVKTADCDHEWKYGEDVCTKCGKKGGLEPVDDARIAWVPVLGTIGDGATNLQPTQKEKDSAE